MSYKYSFSLCGIKTKFLTKAQEANFLVKSTLETDVGA